VKLWVSGGGDADEGAADPAAAEAGASDGVADGGGSLAGPPTLELG
jgi:hypothetical protein